jgi:hypothetical protein
MMVLEMFWGTILGGENHPGFDLAILSGVNAGRGVDGVGVEAAWARENLGTPFEMGEPVMVRFIERKH